jgi:vacuolar protein sorting-associated protein 16
VDSCLEAAANEFNQSRQKTLLKVFERVFLKILLCVLIFIFQAASFGKCFVESYDSERFVKICQAIRVLNSIRHYDIGIPLTFVQ